jgi:hypothetical protein
MASRLAVVITQVKDGRTWRIGTQAEVAWIADGTVTGLTITSGIPPVYEAYATVVIPEELKDHPAHDRIVLDLLTEHSAGLPWWLGYLDTGGDDIVFPAAPKVELYSHWHYVLAEAGPEQAAAWRQGDLATLKGSLPDLMFPADRSWLFSTLWDDDWSCIGGSTALVNSFLGHPDLEARSVGLTQDATPPGHRAM